MQKKYRLQERRLYIGRNISDYYLVDIVTRQPFYYHFDKKAPYTRKDMFSWCPDSVINGWFTQAGLWPYLKNILYELLKPEKPGQRQKALYESWDALTDRLTGKFADR